MSQEARPLRVLALSLSIGAGHHRAAEALCDALVELRPETRWELVDALKYLGPDGGRLARDMYFGLLGDVPDLWGLIYDQKALSELFRPASEVVDDVRTLSLAPRVRAVDPDVILAMHPIACGLSAGLRRTGAARCPVVAVLTDFDAHPTWVGRGIDLYLTATDAMARELEARGLPTGRAVATGIPLRRGFREVRSERRPHQLLGLDPARFTIVLPGGGLGLGPIGDVARSLSRFELPIQVVLLTGNNAELLATAQTWARSASAPLHPVGLVENVWDYVAAADLGVGKPGGLTCAELLAGGVPLVALEPIPGQEQSNCDVLVREGAALEARSAQAACGHVLELLAAPARRETMRVAALKLGRPMSARVAARRVLDLRDEWVDEPIRSSPPADEPLRDASRAVERRLDEASRVVGSGLDDAARAVEAGFDAVTRAVGLQGKTDPALRNELKKWKKKLGL